MHDAGIIDIDRAADIDICHLRMSQVMPGGSGYLPPLPVGPLEATGGAPSLQAQGIDFFFWSFSPKMRVPQMDGLQ